MDYSSVMFLDRDPVAAPRSTEGDRTGAADAASLRHCQSQLVEKWRWHRRKCRTAAGHVQSLHLADVLAGHDRFWDMHLASSGLI